MWNNRGAEGRDNNLAVSVDKTEKVIIDFWTCAPLSISGCTAEGVKQTLMSSHIERTSLWLWAQQRLHILRKLKQPSPPSSILQTFYRGVLESVLTLNLVLQLQQGRQEDPAEASERVTGVSLPSVSDRVLP